MCLPCITHFCCRVRRIFSRTGHPSSLVASVHTLETPKLAKYVLPGSLELPFIPASDVYKTRIHDVPIETAGLPTLTCTYGSAIKGQIENCILEDLPQSVDENADRISSYCASHENCLELLRSLDRLSRGSIMMDDLFLEPEKSKVTTVVDNALLELGMNSEMVLVKKNEEFLIDEFTKLQNQLFEDVQQLEDVHPAQELLVSSRRSSELVEFLEEDLEKFYKMADSL